MTEGLRSCQGRTEMDMRPGPHGTVCLITVCLVYLAVTLASTYPVWMNPTGTLPGDIGDPLLNTWIMAWDFHTLNQEPAQLFNANIFFPRHNTLAYSEHLLGTTLLSWPVLLLSGEPVLAYNFAFLFGFFASALGVYFLVLHLTGSRFSAFVAGLAFSFAPYRLASISHLQLVTCQWLPVAVLFLDRYLTGTRRRDLVFFALFFWLQILASWHLGAFAAFTVAMAVLYRGVWLRSLSGRQILGVAGACIAVALLTLPLALPYLGASELQEQRPLDAAEAFSATGQDYLAAASENRFFGEITAPFRTQPDFNVERRLFLGVAVPLVAVLSWRFFRRDATPRQRDSIIFYCLLALGAASLTLGPMLTVGDWRVPMPYTAIHALLPQFSLLRVPARWVVVVIFALAVLAGYGTAWLLSCLGRREVRKSTITVVVGLLSLAVIADGWSMPISTAAVGSIRTLSQVYSWIAGQSGDFALVEIPFYAWPSPQYNETKRMYASTTHWKRLVNGYSGYTPPETQRLARELAEFPSSLSMQAVEQLGRSGVRYVIVHTWEEGFSRWEWENQGIWEAGRAGLLFPRYTADGDIVYEINPYGSGLFTSQESLSDSRWQPIAQRRVAASLGSNITLLGYEVHEERESVTLSLYWQARERATESYTVFVHLVDGSGNTTAQADSLPDEGRYPTTAWRQGEVVRDVHRLPVSESHSGDHFVVGMYLLETMERLPAVNSAGELSDRVILPR
ncbi:MAG: hypothetical protein Q8O07_00355 [Chloroflexota bacterium]|nr:hypothetical protein [Chloroflexota bacterium]